MNNPPEQPPDAPSRATKGEFAPSTIATPSPEPGLGGQAAAGTGAPPAASTGAYSTRADDAGGTGLVKHGAVGFAVTATLVILNMVTGVIIARGLGAEGRGILTAVLFLPQTLGFLFSAGCLQATSFHQARHPDAGSVLFSTWAGILAVLSLGAIGLGELLLPALLAAQPPAAIEFARVYLLVVFLIVFSELALGILLGDQRFRAYSLLRVAQPLALVAAYAALAALEAFSISNVLVVTATTGLITVSIATLSVVRTHGLARPSLGLGRRTLGYGLRAYAGPGLLANVRLDLLLIPAFLGAIDVGLYTIASSVAVAFLLLANTLAAFVLPVAARDSRASPRIVLPALWATVGVAIIGAVALAALAEPALELVYGAEFGDSATALRFLLLGAVFFVGASILVSGLFALDRPLWGSAAIVGGMLVILVAITAVLRGAGGHIAVAAGNACGGLAAFALAIVLYKRAAALRWRQLLPRQSYIAEITRLAHGAIARSLRLSRGRGS